MILDTGGRRGRVAGALATTLLVGLAWLPAVDGPGRDYVEASLGQALSVFATARAINAGLSVLQSTEIEGSLLFVSGTLGIGEVLDPANDLIERFSWVLLASVAALGIQQVLAGAAGHAVLAGIVTVAGALLLAALLTRPGGSGAAGRLALRLFLLALLLRFAMPVAGVLSAGADRLFLADQLASSAEQLEVTERAIERKRSQLEKPPATLREKLGAIVDAPAWLRQSFDELADYAGRIVDSVTRLIALFVLKSVILPLAFLWGFARALKGVAAPRGSYS
jgi:hypothetical protein